MRLVGVNHRSSDSIVDRKLLLRRFLPATRVPFGSIVAVRERPEPTQSGRSALTEIERLLPVAVMQSVVKRICRPLSGWPRCTPVHVANALPASAGVHKVVNPILHFNLPFEGGPFRRHSAHACTPNFKWKDPPLHVQYFVPHTRLVQPVSSRQLHHCNANRIDACHLQGHRSLRRYLSEDRPLIRRFC